MNSMQTEHLQFSNTTTINKPDSLFYRRYIYMPALYCMYDTDVTSLHIRAKHRSIGLNVLCRPDEDMISLKKLCYLCLKKIHLGYTLFAPDVSGYRLLDVHTEGNLVWYYSVGHQKSVSAPIMRKQTI